MYQVLCHVLGGIRKFKKESLSSKSLTSHGRKEKPECQGCAGHWRTGSAQEHRESHRGSVTAFEHNCIRIGDFGKLG